MSNLPVLSVQEQDAIETVFDLSKDAERLEKSRHAIEGKRLTLTCVSKGVDGGKGGHDNKVMQFGTPRASELWGVGR